MKKILLTKKIKAPIINFEDMEEEIMGRRIVCESEYKGLKLEKEEKLYDNYLTKLLKLIPAEIVTLYITLSAILDSSKDTTKGIEFAVFFIVLLLTPIYIYLITKDKNKKIPWKQIVVSTFSFLVWVFALGGPFTYFKWYKKLYGALLLPIYTFLIPLIFKKRE